jgi:hypothetical protein
MCTPRENPAETAVSSAHRVEPAIAARPDREARSDRQTGELDPAPRQVLAAEPGSIGWPSA